jgi:hypothetical protein
VSVRRARYEESSQTVDFYRGRATPLTSPHGVPFESWILNRKVPARWSLQEGAKILPSEGGIAISTSPSKSGYQLVSPTVSLPPGQYEASALGSVRSGGLELGVLNYKKNTWISNSFFWSGQFASHPIGSMGARFYLERATVIRIVLANSAPTDHKSEWLIRRVIVRDTGVGGG